ncbi:hypothetical protein GGTG_08015 [Gaeumannomyces tritici R3-111a-1]|uniref:Monocarboxylate transporter n=1 Tax=Gaeumannomyces tritici (strain R3-111a-1) TaxID=644352 RepID=J3P3C8_GAET3|nr:hypothetical protein GGTG_08015 [Gaeumannomyces tritici R3-111a-1]EJT74170.1 hypothetical protein GGTG_08015 [Gaeumannomyces tritici R3-111a-1]
MSQLEDHSLRPYPSPGRQVEAPGVAEETDSPQRESRRRRVCVLVGCSLLQLPLWGFSMSYGVFQEYYYANWTLDGAREQTGIIGTTSNGVMYLSMPLLFALFAKRWAKWRQTAAVLGAIVTCLSFLLSSFSTNVWHLIATQGVLAAMGSALTYSPTTLSLGEWFGTNNRAVAYGIVLSCKNVVGSVCPFIVRALLDRYGFRTALRLWAAIVAATSLAILLLSAPPSGSSSTASHPRKIPWQFLTHRTFYVHGVAIVLQSAGYAIPQTYLNTYAHEVSLLSQASATLLLTLFNVPGIASSSFFGYLSDNRHLRLSAATVTSISAVSSALSAFLFWGLASKGSMALLVLFSVTFGFFAGGYSATWGGVLNEMEREAAERNEAIDTGVLYGLLNGARGIGYLSGGLAGVPLLKAGRGAIGSFGYGTSYGPLILFTGLSSIFGGWGLLWKWLHLL